MMSDIKKTKFEKKDFPSISSLHSAFESPACEGSNLLREGERVFRHLLETQDSEVLLHGDLHHENVRSRESGEFVCFDPKGFRGDPAYELATTLKNPWDFPEISQDILQFESRANFFADDLELPFNRVVGFAFSHLCLSALWAMQSKDSAQHQVQLAEKVFFHFRSILTKL